MQGCEKNAASSEQGFAVHDAIVGSPIRATLGLEGIY